MGQALSGWDTVQLGQMGGQWPLVSLKPLLSGSSSAAGQEPELDTLHTREDKEAGKYIVILFFSFT